MTTSTHTRPLSNAVTRLGGERGHTRMSWLESHHTFSFGDYYDPRHMGFSDLRVINDDVVAPGGGFSMHGHRDMEIISVVLSGALSHKDSMGNGSVIRPGEVQRMSAGTGVRHSEFNPSETEPAHLLQIWILPEALGATPGYEQRMFPEAERRGRFRLIASRAGRDGSVTIGQDAELYQSLLAASDTASFNTRTNRKYWLHVATGTISVAGQTLTAGDALAFTGDDRNVTVEGLEADTQALLFNLRE